MATIVTRAGKGAPLTHDEVDANFTNLNNDKLESGDTVASLTLTSADINGGTIDGTVIGGSTPAAISGTTGQFDTSLNVDGTITSDGLTVADGLVHEGDADTYIKFLNNRIYSDVGGSRLLDLQNGTSELNNQGAVEFNTGASLLRRLNIASNGDISFYEDTGTTPKFFWDASAESLGIGTSSPVSKLVVSNNGAAGMEIVPDDAAGPAIYSYNRSTSAWVPFQVFSESIRLRTNGTTDAVTIDSSGNVGIGTSSPSATLDVNGSLSKSSGSFKIDHPIKPETHHLVHSFIEGPQADNLYRGKVTLVAGAAAVNLDEAARMTEGTFAALNGNVQCFTTNEDGWTAVRGKVSGNILTIEAQDAACTDTVSWLVIGERHDQHMIEANWTDDQGRIITEPEKEIAE